MSAPKPVTAKQVKRAIDKYEIAYNDIMEIVRISSPDEDAGEVWILNDSALALHRQLNSLYDALARAEKEARR